MVSRISSASFTYWVSRNTISFLFLPPNSIQFHLCFFGVIVIGSITIVDNPMYTVSNFPSKLNPMLIITVPELLDKVNGLNLPILLFCHQKNSNLSVVTFTGLVDKAGYVNWDNCGIKQSGTEALCLCLCFMCLVLLLSCIHSCRGVILLCLWHIGSGAAPFGKELMENCAKSSPLAVVAQ